jgi:dTDP-4-dehydrorhamnose reductase
VTGGTGLLGGVLCPYLKAQGREVIVHGGRSGEVAFDLADGEIARNYLSRLKPGFILNLVGLTDVDGCERDVEAAYRGNVRSAEVLTEWVGEHPSATRLIHISTDQVYDGPGEKKESEVTIRNVYALSKLCAEKTVASVGATVLRTNFFGKSPVPHRSSLSDTFFKVFSTGAPVKLFNDIYFSPLSMRTLSAMLLKVVDRPVPGVFNLGSREGMTKADFGLQLAAVFGFSTEHAQVVESTSAALLARRPKDMRMSVAKFERDFDVRLPLLEEEIRLLRSEYV